MPPMVAVAVPITMPIGRVLGKDMIAPSRETAVAVPDGADTIYVIVSDRSEILSAIVLESRKTVATAELTKRRGRRTHAHR